MLFEERFDLCSIAFFIAALNSDGDGIALLDAKAHKSHKLLGFR